MKDDVDIEALLNQLISDQEVDWSIAKNLNEQQQDLVNQLQHIKTIQGVFKSQKVSPVAQNHKPQILFEWGHLNVIEKLGEGGFGEVFRAFDPVLNREVALKLLKSEQVAGFHRKLFIEEAQRIARIRNRHVLAIHGAGVNLGRAGFWADLIVGKTLGDAKQGSLEELIKVTTALANALHAVHENGLIHGDVKASNVMLDQNKQYILMDFGAGAEQDSDDVSNHNIGSPYLMAPELFMDQPKSAASDMYALGCVIFQMASDRYPLVADNVVELMAAHQHQKYTSLNHLRPDLPRSILSLVADLTHPQKNKRPSAQETIKRIELIRTEPQRRRRKRLVLGIIGSLLLGVLISSVGFFQANQARKEAVKEQQKAESVNEFLQQTLGATFTMGEGREVRLSDVLDVAAANLNQSYLNQPNEKAAVSEAIGRSYSGLKIWEKSQLHLEQSLQLKQQLFGDNHPETWRIKLELSRVMRVLGEYQLSMDLYQAIIDGSQKTANVGNLKEFATIGLANTLIYKSEYVAALKLLDEQFKDVPPVEEAINNYPYLALMARGEAYLGQTRFDDALATFDLALMWHEKYPDSKPSNEFALKNFIGITQAKMGRHADAEVTMRALLEMTDKLYGKSNSTYLSILTNLGGLLQAQGKLKESLLILESSMELATEIKGKHHMLTFSIATNLSNAYVSSGNLEAGEKLMRETLDFAYSSLGHEVNETFTLEYNLSELLNNTQKFIAAEQLTRKSLIHLEATLGSDHLITLLSQDNLAVSLSGQGKHQNALDLHEQVLNDIKQVFGEKSPYVWLVWSHRVDSLQNAGQIKEAIELQDQLLKMHTQLFGESHATTAEAQARLTDLQQDTNNQ